VSWLAPRADGAPGFSANQLSTPGRYNFIQAAVYRIKLSDIPHPSVKVLYPTLEVVPSNAKTDPFLAHSAVPVTFTDEDFEQVAAGNYVVKVIYLPDPQFQDLATTGPDEVVSSRLEPGVDPVAEAHRRGSILLIVRLGNIDLEAANTPPMDAPPGYGPHAASGNPMPRGGMMMPPGGPMMGMPGMPMPPMMPPAAGAPAVSPLQQQGAGKTPVTMLPDPSSVQQTQYKGKMATPAELAGQSWDPSPATESKSAPSRKWWIPGSGSGK
jgi:hypothetical protein